MGLKFIPRLSAVAQRAKVEKREHSLEPEASGEQDSQLEFRPQSAGILTENYDKIISFFMHEELLLGTENFQFASFDQETFSQKSHEVWQMMNPIRHEIGSAFGDEDFFIGDLIGGASQTFLVHDAREELAAWAAIHEDYDRKNILHGISSCVVSPTSRQKGIATFLAKKMIKFCQESNKISTAQFNIRWDNDNSIKTLQKACRQLGIEWSSIQKITGDLSSEMNSFRV
jgi:RimJ/RimL family protein N-acetyltransferase